MLTYYVSVKKVTYCVSVRLVTYRISEKMVTYCVSVKIVTFCYFSKDGNVLCFRMVTYFVSVKMVTSCVLVKIVTYCVSVTQVTSCVSGRPVCTRWSSWQLKPRLVHVLNQACLSSLLTSLQRPPLLRSLLLEFLYVVNWIHFNDKQE